MKEHLAEAQPSITPANRSESSSSWRFRGSYYITPNEKGRTWYWLLGLICFILLLILLVTLTIILIFLKRSPEPKTVWFQSEWEDKCGGGKLNDTALKYKDFYFKYNKTFNNFCKNYKIYEKAEKNIAKFSKEPQITTKLGHSWFSDQTAEQLTKSIGKIGPVEEYYFGVRETDVLDDKNIRSYKDLAKNIKFNDSAPLDENLKTASLQYIWQYNSAKEFRNTYPNVDSLLARVDRVGLRFQSKATNQTFENHVKYLARMGIFFTEIQINDFFLLYKSGVYTKELCPLPGNENQTLPVFILGYGMEKINGNDVEYWEIQPVGERFKEWGENGIMKLSRDCYMRGGLPRLLDVFDKEDSNYNNDIMNKVIIRPYES